MDRVLSGELRNISDNLEYDVGKSVDSSVDSRPQSWDNTSETTSNSDMSEIAIHSLLVDWKQRGLDRETHQDPDRDRYTSDEEGTVVDNAADELELVAVSKRPTRLLPHGMVATYQSGTICAGSIAFEKDMVCQVDGRCSCSGDNEWGNERGKDVFESQVEAVRSPKGSTK